MTITRLAASVCPSVCG
uniref:Uncharacterized protein n=1 Tax=Arundo donax TaxID=35708 RepID=A0A0A8Z371_ARUDO